MLSEVMSSTTTPLAGAATFTGLAFPCDDAENIVISCYADVAGTLYVDQRNDGTNWDIVSSFSYAAGATDGYSVLVAASEARVRFVNGAGAQAAFRLYIRKRAN